MASEAASGNARGGLGELLITVEPTSEPPNRAIANLYQEETRLLASEAGCHRFLGYGNSSLQGGPLSKLLDAASRFGA